MAIQRLTTLVASGVALHPACDMLWLMVLDRPCRGVATAAVISISSLQVARVAAIPANLLAVTAARQISHPHRGPADIGHYSCGTAKHARDPIALWDFKKI